VPVAFTWGHDDGITGLEILTVAALGLNTDPALNDEEPLRTGVCVPIRSCTVRECHSIHTNRNTGVVMSQALNCRAADEGRRINRADRRLARSKDAHRTLRLLHLEAIDLHFGHVVHPEPDDAIGWDLELRLRRRVHDRAVDDVRDCVARHTHFECID